MLQGTEQHEGEYDSPTAFSVYKPFKGDADINFVLLPGVQDPSCGGSGQRLQYILRVTFPQSRILTYQYPDGPDSHQSIHDLLHDLSVLLTGNTHSIHFICHSDGGLIGKQAIIASSKASKPSLRAIYDATRSVSFFSMCHQTAKFNHLIENGTNRDIKVLSVAAAPQKSTSGDLSEAFQKILTFSKEQADQLRTFDAISEVLSVHYAHFVADLVSVAKTKASGTDDGDEKQSSRGKVINVSYVDPDPFVQLQPFEDYVKQPSLGTMIAVFDAQLKLRGNSQSSQLAALTSLTTANKTHKAMEQLLETQEFVQLDFVDKAKIHESIELSLKFWRLLAESKTAVTQQQAQTDRMLRVCLRWKSIIEKRVDYVEGKGPALNQSHARFMKTVYKQLAEYFHTDAKDMDAVNKKWQALHEELTEMHGWWTRTLAQVKAWAKKQLNTSQSKTKKALRVIKWVTVVGTGIALIATGVGLAVGLGVAVGVAAAYLAMAGVAVFHGVCMAKSIGPIHWGQLAHARTQKKALEREKRLEELQTNVQQVQQQFANMKKDSSAMSKHFMDFGDSLIKEMLPNEKRLVQELADADADSDADIDWFDVLIHVESLVDSLGKLKDKCIETKGKISESQDTFYDTK